MSIRKTKAAAKAKRVIPNVFQINPAATAAELKEAGELLFSTINAAGATQSDRHTRAEGYNGAVELFLVLEDARKKRRVKQAA